MLVSRVRNTLARIGAMATAGDNYIIVDIGANLTNKKFSRDLDAVIQRAREAGETCTNNYRSFILSQVPITTMSEFVMKNYLFLSGVTKIMCTGTSLNGSKDALRLARLYPEMLYATAGEKHIALPHSSSSREYCSFQGFILMTLSCGTTSVWRPCASWCRTPSAWRWASAASTSTGTSPLLKFSCKYSRSR
jgi:hypothetical protein